MELLYIFLQLLLYQSLKNICKKIDPAKLRDFWEEKTMIEKLHRTIYSLLKKHYTVEFWNENDHVIILSFYHLNSVYNGLCYINKYNGDINIDFQYHRHNKQVKKQLENICQRVGGLYKLSGLDCAIEILNNYKPLANEIYKNNYSILRGKTA